MNYLQRFVLIGDEDYLPTKFLPKVHKETFTGIYERSFYAPDDYNILEAQDEYHPNMIFVKDNRCTMRFVKEIEVNIIILSLTELMELTECMTEGLIIWKSGDVYYRGYKIMCDYPGLSDYEEA